MSTPYARWYLLRRKRARLAAQGVNPSQPIYITSGYIAEGYFGSN